MIKDIFFKLEENIDSYAQEALEHQFNEEPSLKHLNPQQKKHSLEDTAYHIKYLSESIAYDDINIYINYAKWVKHLFLNRNLPLKWFHNSLKSIQIILESNFETDEISLINSFIDAAINELENEDSLKSYIDTSTELGRYARLYTEKLIDADRVGASNLIDELIEKTYSVEDIYLEIFAKSQYEIGKMWQENRITIAQEHYCTAATQTIMSKLYPFIFATKKTDKKAVVACTKNELHEIGARMVADFLELYGWQTYYIGAQGHHQSVVDSIESFNADIVAISATLSSHISEVEELISFIKKNEKTKNIKIIVGGSPFNANPNLYKKVSADAYAINAKLAVDKCEELYNE